MMAAGQKKTEVASIGEQQASLVVNNAFIDGLAKQVEKKKEYGLTFPPDYNPTNALNGAYLILQETKDKNNKPVLESCSRDSVAHTLMDMVTMGLSMQKKQCYPIPYGGQLQCQVSYHGHKAMAHRYGAKTIDAEVIYEGDDFQYHIENGRKVLDKHTQDFRNIDLTKIVGAYCVVTMYDGSQYVEVMNINQIENAWRKRQGGYTKGKAGATHTDFTDMMAKKTVTSRACKQIVQQYGDVFAVDAFENAESHERDDRVAIDANYEVQQNANTEDFPEDVIDAVAQEVPEQTVQELQEMATDNTDDVPDFMR